MAGPDRVAISGQRNRAFDLVTEFPDVTGPIVTGENVERFRVKSFDAPVIALHRKIEEVSRQQGNVFAALAQWRKADGENRHTIIEVLTKIAPFDLRLQIASGRR